MKERPRLDCLFPQLAPGKSPTPVPSQPREPSRCSRSEPLLPSSFGRAALPRRRANAETAPQAVAASAVSAATTAFMAGGSQLGAGGGAAAGSKAGPAHSGSGVAPSREMDALEVAVANAADEEAQNNFQASMPYRTKPASSIVSSWRLHYWTEVGKGSALQRGLTGQDLRDGTANTPGVCVLRQQDDAPKTPGIHSGAYLEKQRIIDSVTSQLRQMGVTLTDAPGTTKQTAHSRSVSEARSQLPGQDVPKPNIGSVKRGSSEVSLGNSSADRRNSLPAVVARSRYQTFVVNKPQKGHRYCEPESTNAP